jgi:hypothetical protein
MEQIIRCVNCDQIFHHTSFDQLPEYVSSPTSSEPFQEKERDDYRDFLKSHRGHRLEDLKIIEDSFVSENPYLEPIKVSYFKATNGKERFVIRKFRKDIHDPLTYDLIYGDVTLKCVKIEAQTREIKKQMEMELAGLGLSEKQLDDFIRLIQGLTKRVDIRNLTRVTEDSSHPLEIYYRMDDVSYAYLLRNCRTIFREAEFTAIQEFIDRHRDDGVLLWKATHEIQLIQATQPRRKPYPIQEPVEQKSAVKKK